MVGKNEKQDTNQGQESGEKKSFIKSWKGKSLLGIVGVIILANILADSPEDKAKKAGFDSVTQMETASELGFTTGDEYEAHLAKKAEEKRLAEAEEKRKKDEEKKKKAELLQANLENAQWLVDEYGASMKGSSECRKKVEKLAKFDFEWTDGFLGSKFPSYLTKTQSPGVVVLAGDRVKFQNGFGAWQNVEYYCAYDVVNNNALDAWID